MEITMAVIRRLWGFSHREGKENPGGDYLQLHKATKAIELRDLLLFDAINSSTLHRNGAGEGNWGTEGQDTWWVWWPEEIQVAPGSPSRDHLSESQRDLIHSNSPPSPTHPCRSMKPSRAEPWCANQKPDPGKNVKREREGDVEMPGTERAQREQTWSLRQR